MPRQRRANRRLLNDIELELMRCVWERRTASASAVQLMLVRKGKETTYTTVKTILDRLVRAGVCTSEEVKGRFQYTSVLSQSDIAKEWLRHLNGKIFGKQPRQ